MNVRHQQRTVDLAVLRKNVRLLRESLPAGTGLLAVVKADAYGHGMVQVAREALHAGAMHLAVALVEEGVALRSSGIGAPVLVLGATSYEEALLGVEHGLTITVCDAAMVHAVEKAAVDCGKSAMVHLKVDTGMSRIGARNEADVQAVLEALAECPHVRLNGVFTHFADADGDDMAFTHQQLERFKQLIAPLPDGILRHCANSAAIHRLPEAAMDMARAGISMYGYPPVETDLPLRPCMTWETIVTHVKCVQAGECIGYGCTFAAPDEMSVATVACGYGDGYHRAASGRAEVLIGGRRCRVVGRICMDQMMVDVTGVPQVCAGDRVVLMGDMDGQRITADDIAAWADTIPYEILLGAPARVRRIYTE